MVTLISSTREPRHRGRSGLQSLSQVVAEPGRDLLAVRGAKRSDRGCVLQKSARGVLACPAHRCSQSQEVFAARGKAAAAQVGLEMLHGPQPGDSESGRCFAVPRCNALRAPRRGRCGRERKLAPDFRGRGLPADPDAGARAGAWPLPSPRPEPHRRRGIGLKCSLGRGRVKSFWKGF